MAAVLVPEYILAGLLLLGLGAAFDSAAVRRTWWRLLVVAVYLAGLMALAVRCPAFHP
jgi:predicted membrane channel-forming protein YqfA (hemolysin III family)